MNLRVLTLMVGGGDVVALVAAAVFALHVIASIARAKSKAKQAGPSNSSGTPANKARLEELARKRREELMRLSEMRTSAGAPGPQSISNLDEMSDRPVNLTMAEYTARQQAKTLYERRAEALRKQMQGKTVSTTAAPAPPPPVRPQPPRPLPLNRPAPPRPAPQRAAPQRQPVARAPVTPSLRPAAPPRIDRDSRRLDQAVGKAVDSDMPVITTEVLSDGARAMDSPPPPPQAPALRRALSGQSIRAAFILKEVLDKPLGLRSPDHAAEGL